MLNQSYAALLIALLSVAAPTRLYAQATSPSEARAIAAEAYVYAYAMTESYQTWRAQAVDKSSKA